MTEHHERVLEKCCVTLGVSESADYAELVTSRNRQRRKFLSTLHSSKRLYLGKVSIFLWQSEFLRLAFTKSRTWFVAAMFVRFSNNGRKPVFLNWLLRSSALAGTRNSQLAISCHRINNNAVALFCGEVKCLVLIQQREPFVEEQEVTFP